MEDIANAFEELMDPEVWTRAFAVGGGYAGASVAHNLLDNRLPVDVPDEAYGVLTAAASTYAPAYETEIMLGGGLHTADQAADRFDVKDTILSVGE